MLEVVWFGTHLRGHAFFRYVVYKLLQERYELSLGLLHVDVRAPDDKLWFGCSVAGNTFRSRVSWLQSHNKLKGCMIEYVGSNSKKDLIQLKKFAVTLHIGQIVCISSNL